MKEHEQGILYDHSSHLLGVISVTFFLRRPASDSSSQILIQISVFWVVVATNAALLVENQTRYGRNQFVQSVGAAQIGTEGLILSDVIERRKNQILVFTLSEQWTAFEVGKG